MKKILLCICILVMCISFSPSTKTSVKERLTKFYYSKNQEEFQRKVARFYNRPYVEKYVNGFQYTDTLKIYYDAELVAELKVSEADFSKPTDKSLLVPVKFI